MLSIAARIPKTKRSGSLQPVLPLIPEKLPSTEDEKSPFLSFELKTRVGQPADSTKYKKYVRKFEEGTPQQWIDLQRDLEEIWTQNSINGGTDRASTVRALVRGDSATAFEAALQEERQDADGVEAPITADHVTLALHAVRAEVFPHRALEIQKLWMNRRMFKPPELTTRQTAAAINRLNNALPLFPSGMDASKFSDAEIVGLLEWSLPPDWQTKFDLDGYVPTLHNKAKLIQACEAIERNESTSQKASKTSDQDNKKTGKKSGKTTTKGSKSDNSSSRSKFYCTEHGHNNTHGTSSCRVLNNKNSASTSTHNKSRGFSNKGLRREINLLAQSSSKRKVLDLYSSTIKREQRKLDKKKQKRKERDSASSSKSESDIKKSLQLILEDKPKKSKKSSSKAKVQSVNAISAETLQEEQAYQKKVQWLKDHGDSDKDEPTEKKRSTSSKKD